MTTARTHRQIRTLLGVVLMVAAIGAGTELLLRLGIKLQLAGLDNPANYVDPFCDDDYHKLRYLWRTGGALRTGRNQQHPRYGWIRIDTADDSRHEIGEPRIAVFGDSFVAGVDPTPPHGRIAQRLRDLIPKGVLTDLSGAGYGLDQIYLRVMDTLEDPDQRPDVAIVGIFLGDIDRVVERFRAGPKPYFEIEADALVLRGVPIEATPEEWLETNPPRIRSFSLALIRRRLERLRGQGGGPETDCRRAEKREIAQRLIGDMVNKATEVGTELVIVPILGLPHMARTSWRESFLEAVLEEEDAAFIDFKEALLQAADSLNLEAEDFYYPPPNGHFNDRGNRLVARLVYEELAVRYGWDRRDEVFAPPEAILMGRRGNWDRARDCGWGLHGKSFSWMVQPRATVRFTDLEFGHRAIVTVEILRVLTSADDRRQLRILANGHVARAIPVAELPSEWLPTLFEAELDTGLLVGQEELIVALELEPLLEPRHSADSHLSRQRRGVAVKSIRLDTR